jgi:hypothetical protein
MEDVLFILFMWLSIAPMIYVADAPIVSFFFGCMTCAAFIGSRVFCDLYTDIYASYPTKSTIVIKDD